MDDAAQAERITDPRAAVRAKGLAWARPVKGG